MKENRASIDSICSALCYALGIEPPRQANAPDERLKKFIDEKFSDKKADRIFMYNPDAVAEWIVEKYPQFISEVTSRSQIELPYRSVMPCVTPVCYGTIYTGALPDVHGIKAYAKPVIKIDTIFDALIRAGKKPVIVAVNGCSMSKIYLERDMDYFIFDTYEEVNAKAAQLIVEDKYDFYAVYNGNYDSTMHKFGPEAPIALAELKANSRQFGTFAEMISNLWKDHRTLAGFVMDHGCHEIDGGCGSHGLDMPEDMNIRHYYSAFGV
ncbi:MAG: hypothetical protein IJV00_05140 [Clostridia bacterium]|nr:hypothetical protein [Clostridia bacterium]